MCQLFVHAAMLSSMMTAQTRLAVAKISAKPILAVLSAYSCEAHSSLTPPSAKPALVWQIHSTAVFFSLRKVMVEMRQIHGAAVRSSRR